MSGNVPEDWLSSTSATGTAGCRSAAAAAPRDPGDSALEAGDKLWSAQLRRSPTLHRRLIELKLQRPHGNGLRVEDGVDHADLLQELDAFLAGDEFLARFVGGVGDAVREGARRIPLAPAAQLLLTAAQQNDPRAYRHAVKGMAVAGALALRTRAPVHLVEQAFVAGLLHDIGEIYQGAEAQSRSRLLTAAQYGDLTSHPLVGAMLLRRLTDYPDAVCRAVGEHHERLDGTGYPGQWQQSVISTLGQLLILVELMLGLGERGDDTASAISFALRFMPAETNAAWVAPVIRVADAHRRPAAALTEAVQSELLRLHGAVDELLRRARDLVADRRVEVARVGARALARLERLRQAAIDHGLWPDPHDATAHADDARQAVRELGYRLSMLRRECLWPESDAGLHTDPALVALWRQIEPHGSAFD